MATDPITDVANADSYGAALIDKVRTGLIKRHWWHIQAISADMTVSDSDEFLSVDCSGSGGDVTISLPEASTVPGQSVIIHCSAAVSGQSVVIQSEVSAETVGEATDQSLTAAGEFIHLICDGIDDWLLYIDGR